MNLSRSLLFLSATCLLIKRTHTIGFAIPAIGLGLSASYAGYEYLKGYMYEVCNPLNERNEHRTWIRNGPQAYERLEANLTKYLYGQPLAHKVVTKAIRAHLMDEKPVKALVMSFHGWSGSGKNHVSRLIADGIYVNGPKSMFVRHLFGSHYQDVGNITAYKVRSHSLLALLNSV